jgi:nitrous oxide reductase accessory protein NosL
MKRVLRVDEKVAARLAARETGGKLASGKAARHDLAMRHLALVPILFIAACAPRVTAPTPTPTPVERPPSGVLIGLTASELGGRFGQPTFQVREGAGTKLQWSENGCVLDAYLYPPENGRGVDRVTHVDARNPSGADLSVESCLALLAR